MTTASSLVLCAILAGLGAFQVALALGAPLGHYAWGGQHRVLPLRLRVGSAVSPIVYAAMGLVVLHRADVVDVGVEDGFAEVATWVVAGYFALGIVVNGASRSRPERLLMTPLCAVLAALSVVVAPS